jgi:hypothetical protein
MDPFWDVAKQLKSGSNGVNPYSPRHIGLGSYKTFGRACIILSMNASRIHQTGKLPFSEVVDDKDHEHDFYILYCQGTI